MLKKRAVCLKCFSINFMSNGDGRRGSITWAGKEHCWFADRS